MLRLLPLFLTLPLLAHPVPKDASPRTPVPNSNSLLKANASAMTFDCSSQFNGWPIDKLFDGEPTTSWYSNTNDCPMNGATPWVRVSFAKAVSVRRVTVLGNREPQFPSGYFVTSGYFEFLNAAGDVIEKVTLDSNGEKHDFDFEPRKPIDGVRAIRFTCTKDQKQLNCIGLGEMQAE